MVNNKQVNLWRGDNVPPTIYHIWIKDNSKLLLYDGKEWVVFLDNKEIIDIIDEIQDSIESLQKQVQDLGDKTVNSKPIKTNPVLDGTDILIEGTGNFLTNKDSTTQALLRLDKLLTTQIIE